MYPSEIAKERRRREREIREAIHQVLMTEWDPIGVAGVPEAADEYDHYIGGVYRLLASQADARTIACHLAAIQTDRMGLPQEPDNLMEVARRLQVIDVRLPPGSTTSLGL